MKYELAKELKDASFPSDIQLSDTAVHCTPNLTELIEACETRDTGFSCLIKEKDYWVARGWREGSKDNWIEIAGATPEEAVARLWLALNKPAITP